MVLVQIIFFWKKYLDGVDVGPDDKPFPIESSIYDYSKPQNENACGKFLYTSDYNIKNISVSIRQSDWSKIAKILYSQNFVTFVEVSAALDTDHSTVMTHLSYNCPSRKTQTLKYLKNRICCRKMKFLPRKVLKMFIPNCFSILS